MFLGKVVGHVWATKKHEELTGLKFLLIHPYNLNAEPVPDMVVACDNLGAGIGEDVIVAYGKAGRVAMGNADLPIEAAVVAVVDQFDLVKEAAISPKRKTAPKTGKR